MVSFCFLIRELSTAVGAAEQQGTGRLTGSLFFGKQKAAQEHPRRQYEHNNTFVSLDLYPQVDLKLGYDKSYAQKALPDQG